MQCWLSHKNGTSEGALYFHYLNPEYSLIFGNPLVLRDPRGVEGPRGGLLSLVCKLNKLKKTVAAWALPLLFFFLPQAGFGADLMVEVIAPKGMKGRVQFTLFAASEDFLKRSVAETSAEVENGTAATKFQKLKAGSYAVSVYLDENNNRKLDTNFIGYPTEPFGFSNNPKVYGRPTFDDAKIELGDGDKKIQVFLSR